MNQRGDMSIENSAFEDSVRARIDELKALYVDLLLFLDRSVDDPGDENGEYPATRSLQTSVDQLARTLRDRSEALGSMLRSGGDWRRRCSSALREEIEDFKLKLRSGLTAMLERIEARTRQLTQQQERVKDDLLEVRAKRVSRRAYRTPRAPPSSLLDSEV